MKRFLSILLLMLPMAVQAQVYTPNQHIISSTGTGYSNATPTDARSMFYDNNVFKYRDYQSTTEVLNYLNLAKYRTGHFFIFVHSGGTLSGGVWTGGTTTAYWFKNCTADSCLVPVFDAVSITTPSAPTSGVVDDAANTFNWTYTSGYTSPGDYEYRIGGSGSYTTVTAKPISVGNVAIGIGALEVRVKAVPGVSNASASLTNSTAFTIAAGTFTPLIRYENNFAGAILVSPSASSATTPGALMYRKSGGTPRQVLTGDTVEGSYAAIPILDTAYAIGAIKIWDPAHPTDTATNTIAYTRLDTSGCAEQTKLVTIGDSHTGNSWYTNEYGSLGSNYALPAPTGYPGLSLHDFLNDTSKVNPVIRAVDTNKRMELQLQFGRNDASQSISKATQLAERRYADSLFKAVGYDYVLHFTTPPSQWSTLTQPAAEQLRIDVNDTLRVWAAADTNFHIVDVGGDPYVGNPNNTFNSTLYNTATSDRTHLTGTGYAYWSAQALTVLNHLPCIGLAAAPRAHIGDTVEESNVLLTYPGGSTLGSGGGYSGGNGRYFTVAQPSGSFAYNFNGGGILYRGVPSLTWYSHTRFKIDGSIVTFPIPVPGTDWNGIFGLSNGNHTFSMEYDGAQSGSDLLVYDVSVVTNGQRFSGTLTPSTGGTGVIEEDDPMWILYNSSSPSSTNQPFSVISNGIYSAGQSYSTGNAAIIAELQISGASKLRFFHPSAVNFQYWLDNRGTLSASGTVNSGGAGTFTDITLPSTGTHTIMINIGAGSNIIIDKVQAIP